MRRIVIFLFAAATLFAQMPPTVVGSRTVAGSWDATGARSTKPAKSGGTLPATCSTGEVFFNTAASPGQNLYVCIPTNTWSPMAGGGAGAVSSIFGRSGAVTAQAGDYTTAQVTESGSLYFTDARARAAMTGLYESPITAGTASQYWRGDKSWRTLNAAAVTNAVDTTSAYSDPSWITALGWSKLSGVPASFTPSSHASTHLSNGGDAIPAATSSVRGTVTTTTSSSVVVSTDDPRIGSGAGGGAVINTAGLGYVFLPAFPVSSAVIGLSGANKPRYYQVVLHDTITTNQFLILTGGTADAGKTWGVAIYNSSCSRVTGATTTGASAASTWTAVSGNLGGAVTLTPGVYYVAIVTDSDTASVIATPDSNNVASMLFYLDSTPRVFDGANLASISSGTVTWPASCGSRTTLRFANLAYVVLAP